jgi:WhiB family redox-sensing transcriptional regulator
MALTWQRIDLGGDDAERDAWRRGDPADTFDLPDLAAFLHRPQWHAAAACRGQGTKRWFVQRGVTAAAARYFCDRCPVAAECLADALAQPASTDSGIWAGTTVKDRDEMRRHMGAE